MLTQSKDLHHITSVSEYFIITYTSTSLDLPDLCQRYDDVCCY